MRIALVMSMATLMTTAQAAMADVTDQMNIQTGRAVLVVPGIAPQQVAEQVKDALTQFAIPASLNFRPFPSPLPSRPSASKEKSVVISGTPATDYDCNDAYAEITKTPPPVQNALYYNRELLRSCLFAFNGGVRIEIFFHTIKKTESITGSIFNSITKAIRGSDGERITNQLNDNINEIKKNIPSVLIERVEVPGMPVLEPDKEAVARLIPSSSKIEGQVQANDNKPNSTKKPPSANPKQTNSSEIDLSFVGARKELTAMGFKFYDQDQFVEAARRNDYLTVRLFLAAAAISPGGADSKGQTALSFAKERTEMKTILNIFVAAEKSGSYPGNIAEMVLPE